MNAMRDWARAGMFGALALMAAIAMAAGPAPVVAPAAADAGRYKVIVHVGDAEPAKWNVALNNVANLQKELGAANIDIELVAINAGLGMLKVDSPVGGRASRRRSSLASSSSPARIRCAGRSSRATTC
jgi:hypothetical protein